MKDKITYFIIGVLFTLVLLLLINSWNPQSTSTNATAVSICTSNDGNIIYVADIKGVQKSKDGGKTWIYVLAR